MGKYAFSWRRGRPLLGQQCVRSAGVAQPAGGGSRDSQPRPATDLFVAYESACAMLDGGGVACWGNDSHAQLGAGQAATEDGGEPQGRSP